jgi:hypothetical protein
MKLLIGKDTRRRFVIHSGADFEVLRGLEQDGCMRPDVPSQLGGDLDTEISHQRSLQRRRASEAG